MYLKNSSFRICFHFEDVKVMDPTVKGIFVFWQFIIQYDIRETTSTLNFYAIIKTVFNELLKNHPILNNSHPLENANKTIHWLNWKGKGLWGL